MRERAYASGFLTGISVMTIVTVIYWCFLGAGVALHSHGTFKEGDPLLALYESVVSNNYHFERKYRRRIQILRSAVEAHGLV